MLPLGKVQVGMYRELLLSTRIYIKFSIQIVCVGFRVDRERPWAHQPNEIYVTSVTAKPLYVWCSASSTFTLFFDYFNLSGAKSNYIFMVTPQFLSIEPQRPLSYSLVSNSHSTKTGSMVLEFAILKVNILLSQELSSILEASEDKLDQWICSL